MKSYLSNKKNKNITVSMYIILIIFWVTFAFPDITIEIVKEKFLAPVTMIFGSFIGGFTCEGGGAVAFPVFTKILNIQSDVARDFSLAIQSIGMTFASVVIMLKGIKVEKRVAILTILGGLVGTTFSTYLIVPKVNNAIVKIIFTVVICAFGISLLLKNYIFKTKERDEIENLGKSDMLILIIVGFVGGIFTALIGTGIDIITFSFITLYYRIDEKVATPTSVLIIAATSIYGFIFKFFFVGNFSAEALILWKLSFPIAAITAPLGAIVCSKVNRMFIVNFLLFLISCEVISTLLILKISNDVLLISLIVLIITVLFYIKLIKLSKNNRTDSNKEEYGSV